MATFNSKDAISGQEGKAFATIDGQRYDMFQAKTIEATIAKSKTEMRRLGARMVGHKSGPMTGTGSMTIYYGTPMFRKMIKDYKRTGLDLYFDLQIINEDIASESGRQVTILKNCNIDGVTLAMLDVDSDAMEESIDFTFDDFQIPEEFETLPGVRQ